jgi:hypothetical protein
LPFNEATMMMPVPGIRFVVALRYQGAFKPAEATVLRSNQVYWFVVGKSTYCWTRTSEVFIPAGGTVEANRIGFTRLEPRGSSKALYTAGRPPSCNRIVHHDSIKA